MFVLKLGIIMMKIVYFHSKFTIDTFIFFFISSENVLFVLTFKRFNSLLWHVQLKLSLKGLTIITMLVDDLYFTTYEF